MGQGNWFRRGRRRAASAGLRARQATGKRRTGTFSNLLLRFEELESRRMLANFTVVNLNDTIINDDDEVETVEGSLRWAVEQANDNDEADVITFLNGLTGTIQLNNGHIEIDGGLRILGPSPTLITVAAQGGSRIFFIDNGDDEGQSNTEVSGLTLTGGNPQGEEEVRGGAIFNLENLRMTEVILSNNTSSQGGGAIYHDRGELIINRALFTNNEAGNLGGGAIMVGAAPGDDTTEDGPVPSLEIRNSTLSGNEATSEDEGEGYGGGILLLRGELEIEQCTIYDNSALMGGGVAVFGDVPPEEEGGDPVGDNEATVISSILWNNGGGDLNDVGMSGGDDPMPLEGITESLGYNIIGDTNVTLHASDIDEDPLFTEVQVEPDVFAVALIDVGGVLPVFLPQADSPAVDAGNPELTIMNGGVEQRGRHFRRVYNYTDAAAPRVDIGATELQVGTFIVDLFADESDGQYSSVGTGQDPYVAGDFSLREALLFSEKNPEVDVIQFARGGTITLQAALGALPIAESVSINGLTTAIVTISGGNSTQIFNVNNGIANDASEISINNLVLQNGRTAGFGGAIFNRENLTLDAVTIRNSNATLRGGAVFTEIGNLTIRNSTINNNRVSDDGGAIYINGLDGAPEVQILQSTISGNTAADRGAGITNNGGHLVIRYSTITNNNSASTLASGIANFGAGAVTEVRSTIISGNANNDLGAFFGALSTSFVSLGFNLVGNGIGVTSFNQAGDKPNILDPMLDPLAVTGGRIQTHRPKLGSPVIDMGDPDAVADDGDVPEFDTRGEPFGRVFDGDEDGVDRIDIGAYELQSNTLVVDNAGDESDGNVNPGQLTLREAVELANQNPAHDTIVFDVEKLIMSSGMPVPVIALDNGILQLTDNVSILGPGSGVLAINGTGAGIFYTDNGEESLFDATIVGLELSNSVLNPAIVSRENLSIDDVIFLNNSSLLSGSAINHENGLLKLNNSLISGNSTGDANLDGGALYIRNAIAEITGYTTIVGNNTVATGSDGGAIAIKNSTVTAVNLTVAGNFTPGGNTKGGAIFIENSTVNFEGAIIAGNSTTGTNSRGGALSAVNSHITFEKNSLIAQNFTLGSQAGGGAIHMVGGSLTINNSAILQNTTSGLSSGGGALALEGVATSIAGSSVSENIVNGVGSHGGGVHFVGGSLTIRDSTLARNQAVDANALGGAVYSDTNLAGTQTTVIVNSTVSGNSAGARGGGVFNADGRLEIRHSTITNNAVTFFNAGAGVASRGNASTLTVVQSSIIAGSARLVPENPVSDVDFIEAPFANSFQSLGNNVIGMGNAVGAFTAAGDKTNIADPLLAPLADNGGGLQTHELLPGSPAVNNGSLAFNPNAFTPALTTDQRGAGFDRVKGGRIDTGAFESDISGPTSDFDLNGRVDGADFLTWQRGVGINSGATKAQGDANGDGRVNGADLAAWRSEFGAGGGVALAQAPAAVSGGEMLQAALKPTMSLIVAAAAEPDAGGGAVLTDSSPAGDVGFVAGAGAPTAAVRPSYRPAAARRDAAYEVIDAAYTQVIAPVSIATTVKADFGLNLRESDDATDDLSSEDAVFALLGEGLI